jgi:hypothetical protein
MMVVVVVVRRIFGIGFFFPFSPFLGRGGFSPKKRGGFLLREGREGVDFEVKINKSSQHPPYIVKPVGMTLSDYATLSSSRKDQTSTDVHVLEMIVLLTVIPFLSHPPSPWPRGSFLLSVRGIAKKIRSYSPNLKTIEPVQPNCTTKEKFTCMQQNLAAPFPCAVSPGRPHMTKGKDTCTACGK